MDLTGLSDAELMERRDTLTPEELEAVQLLMLTRAVESSVPAPDGAGDRTVTTAATNPYAQPAEETST